MRALDERPAAALEDGGHARQGAGGDAYAAMVDRGVVLNVGANDAEGCRSPRLWPCAPRTMIPAPATSAAAIFFAEIILVLACRMMGGGMV